MTDLELRLPLGLGYQLRELVFTRAPYEVVALCLVSHADVGSTTRLLVRHVLGLNEGDYLPTTEHGAAWRGSAMLPAIDLAMREGLGIVLVHAHDFAVPARLSPDDLTSARRLVPMFQARVPGRPHGSIVLARGTARAGGCRPDGPPDPQFYGAMRDDDRVAAFPGFSSSDAVAAEAAFCVGTFAQACLAAESQAEAQRQQTCEQWRSFATWYRNTDRTRFASFDRSTEALGRTGLCPVCPGLDP